VDEEMISPAVGNEKFEREGFIMKHTLFLAMAATLICLSACRAAEFYVRLEGSVFEKNIFYQPIEDATFYRLAGVDGDYIAKCKVGGNVLYDKGVDAGRQSQNLAEIRKAGVALTDIYADPLFVDWERGDFRLRPESPALKLGIKSIDVREAGLIKK